MMESKTRMLGASRHAGMILVALTAFGVSNLFAEDTGQPFPLRLLATCLQTNSVGTLSSFSDLDAAVAAGFDRLSNSVMVVYPPGRFAIPQDGGLFVFSTNGEIAANIDWLEPTTALGVPLYKMGVIETQLTERSWI
jgi:hypothetical protein